jgi:small conductance mechanosensitive channel
MPEGTLDLDMIEETLDLEVIGETLDVNLFAALGLRIGVAAALILLGWFIARVTGRSLNRVLRRPAVEARLGPTMRNVLVRAARGTLLVCTGAIALVVIGVPERIVGYVLAAVLIVLGLALRESLANLAATIIFAIFRPFKLGDHIETLDVQGIVEDIQLFNTVIRLFDGRVASLPNNRIQEAGVVNVTRNELLVAPVDLVVGYTEDLAMLRRILHQLLVEDERILDDPAPEIVVVELSSDGVFVQARPVVRYGDRWQVTCDLREAIVARFASAGVRLAAPSEADVRLTHRG